mmetsp:Transcript_36533/g.44073  ORF Transcript_36533/g.44073 Transcript_36533/m.44073 type:complete len:506 (+) Transcript_36533:138-1655(+)
MTRKRYYVYKGEDNETAPQATTNALFSPDLTKIGNRAFENCNHLTSAFIPHTVTAIEERAFCCCGRITELRLSALLHTIGKDSFYECFLISTLFIPSSLHTIEAWAFFNCKSMNQIVPQQEDDALSLKNIGEGTFLGCTSLLSIPDLPYLEIIGTQAFHECTSLVVLPELRSLKIIEFQAFLDCASLTEVTLGPSITSAARDSFNNCLSLVVLQCTYRTGVVLPWAVTHVTVNPNTTHVSNSAFAGCNCLHSIAFPRAVVRIGNSAFWGCTALPTTFSFSKTIDVGLGAFARCTQITDNALKFPPHAMQDIYTWMGGKGEMKPKGIRNLVIDETVTEITKSFFAPCRELAHVIIRPNGIHIQSSAFGRLSKKKSSLIVEMPNVVRWILQGDYGSNTSPNNRTPLPIIDESAFKGHSGHIIDDCKRYSRLRILWDWLKQKELESIDNPHKKTQLNENDVEVLHYTFSLKPLPPPDIVDAILHYLHTYSFIFSWFPRDVIRSMIEYL